jgi:MFS transporter, ACS family, hexuronate transporter
MLEIMPKPIRNLRWFIIGTMFLITAANYLDRQCLSVAAPVISKEFRFTNTDYSMIVTSFLAAYTMMQLLSGVLVDRIGARKGMACFLSWWSGAAVLHTLSNGLSTFCIARFLLGIGEAGNWPTSAKVVSEWFPPRERGMAVAIFDSGSSLGGLLAPPLVTWLIFVQGWRVAFLVTGSIGFLLLMFWLWIYHPPEQHSRILPEERALISRDTFERPLVGPPMGKWGVLRKAEVWGITCGRSLSDCVWWFYVYWLPKYLADQRGLSLYRIAAVSWLPFVMVDIGNLAGGWFSSFLMRHGSTLNASRKYLLLVGAAGMSAGFPAGVTGDVRLSIAFISAATFSYGIWGTMMLTLPTDLFSSEHVGLVSGLSGTGAGLGGIAFTSLTGVVVDRFSYRPIFAAAALLPLLGLVAVQLLIPEVRSLEGFQTGIAQANPT